MRAAGVRRRIFVAGATALVGSAGGWAQDSREVIAERVAEHRQVLEPGIELRVERMPGRIRIRRVPDREMIVDSRYAEGAHASSMAHFSVERDGRTLWLRGTGDVDTPRRVQLRIPEEVALSLDLVGGEILAEDGTGPIDVTGKDLEMDFRGLQGDLRVEVDGGSLGVEGHVGHLAVRGDRLETRIRSVTGDVTVEIFAGRLSAVSIDGETEIEAAESEVVVRGVNRAFRLRAHGGSAVLDGLALGGDLRLEGTTLKLMNSLGPVMVETDSEVRYSALRGPLHVLGFGASVRGMVTTAMVEVKTNQASVDLTRVEGPLRIQGEGLEIRVLGAKGDTYVDASSSSVEITRPTAAVTVESHYGDVKIRESRSAVTIFSKDGNVEVTAAAGPVSIEADGEEVAVEWESMRHDGDSLIYNDGGNVSVTFPAGAACRVEATAGFGKVETELEGIELFDGGSRAEGTLGDATTPAVHVEAAGRVFLGSGAEASEEP